MPQVTHMQVTKHTTLHGEHVHTHTHQNSVASLSELPPGSHTLMEWGNWMPFVTALSYFLPVCKWILTLGSKLNGGFWRKRRERERRGETERENMLIEKNKPKCSSNVCCQLWVTEAYHYCVCSYIFGIPTEVVIYKFKFGTAWNVLLYRYLLFCE